jgi:hypothetical protein
LEHIARSGANRSTDLGAFDLSQAVAGRARRPLREPGGDEYRRILETPPRLNPENRAGSRRLFPSTNTNR